ncbi:unnamed protein product [Cylindrotheca closterium]|uniref:Uncharacterized protein n=1 Tax=Cylindrotheca closterium TaxID=2856 RepID=A0AAD2FSZ2_9STRA|nr:unnamed protein product [Cylindrotheca closterium]
MRSPVPTPMFPPNQGFLPGLPNQSTTPVSSRRQFWHQRPRPPTTWQPKPKSEYYCPGKYSLAISSPTRMGVLTFEQSIKALQPTRNAYHALFDWDVHRIQAAGMAAIQGASFTTRSLVMNPSDALSCFSLLQFLPSDRTDKDLASHINKDEEACMQEDMGEHVTKRASKKTKLYSKGRCASISDIKSTISNVAQLAAFATKNFFMSNNTPFMVEQFDTVMVALSRPDAVQWQHVIDLTGVAVHIIHDLQTVFQVIAYEDKDFTLHAEARPLGTIQRAELFSGARAQTQLLLDKIDEGLRNCRHPNYPRTSALSALISSTAAPDASPSGKRSSESPSSKQDTAASPAKKPKPSSEESTTRGMLICTSTGRPPMPDQKWKVNGVEKTACVNFLFRNFQCTNTRCTLLHLHKRVFHSCPVSEQESFKTWVQSTPNVKRAPGQEPLTVAAASVSTLTRQVNYYVSRPTPTSHCVDPQDECALQDYPPTWTIFDELDPADMLVADRFRHILEQGARGTPTFTRLEQSHFLRNLPSRTALAVESPYGKDSNNRCFKTESTFCHTFVFLYKSGYLDTTTGDRLGKAFSGALLLRLLLKSHEFVDFRPLRSVLPSDTPMGQFMHCWSRMFTASLLHYNLDVATAVRYVGNIHTGAHQDWNALEPELRAASVDDGLNAVQKDFARSHSLVGNPLFAPFLPDTQQIPQGLVVVPGKSDRQICDGTFCPLLESIPTNDMTTKDTEHKVEFPKLLRNHLAYIYNAGISYKSEELYLGDDDVSGAFRHGKWNPNVIGMHTFSIFGFLFFCTGLTFGGNTCPSNFEIIALSRMALAHFLWSQVSTISRVLRYLPAISTSPEPTPDEIAQFTPAEADSINKGVFNPDGSRIPPNFDCLYVDVAKTLRQTIASSVLALYLILGFPDASKGIQDCVSWEKFTTTFSHRRHCLGLLIDSRALMVSLPSEKQDHIIQRLRTFLRQHRLTLQEIAELLGLLSNATTVCRHMRCSYFNLQRFLRLILVHRYRTLIGYHRQKDWELQIASRLSSTFIHRMDGILSRKMAKVLWGSKQSYNLSPAAIQEVKVIIHITKNAGILGSYEPEEASVERQERLPCQFAQSSPVDEENSVATSLEEVRG